VERVQGHEAFGIAERQQQPLQRKPPYAQSVFLYAAENLSVLVPLFVLLDHKSASEIDW